MILTVDMGNSDIVLGVFTEEGNLLATSRTPSLRYKSVDEYVNTIRELLFLKEIKLSKLKDAILSSVVPQLTAVLASAIKKIIGKRPLLLAPGIKTGFDIAVGNPNEVGGDLIADCLGAVKKYGAPAIVVDLGTATKICMVDEKARFKGCIITPGVQISTASLVKLASQLPNVSLEAPMHVIGTNTVDSMNSGIVYGHASMIDGFISRFKKESGLTSAKVIATGGLVNVIIPYCENKDIIIDRNLILEGLFIMYKKNIDNKGDNKHEKK